MSDERPNRFINAATASIVLAVLAVLYSLYFARAFLIPIAVAILLDFLLSPLVRLLKKARIPTVAGAGVVVLALMLTIGIASYRLATPIQKLLNDAPQSISRAQQQLHQLLQPLQRVSENAAKVAAAATQSTAGNKPAEVVVVGPSIMSRLAGTTQRVFIAMLQVLLLLFFLLAGGDLFLEKTIALLPLMHDKKKAVRIARDIESSVSVYLISNLGINVVEGVMVGLALWAIGLPNPILWGVLVTVMEFIPYIGALLMLGLLSVAALATFTDVAHILMVPGAYLLANFIQGNIVTTLVLGRRLALNSVALFVGLAFWFWIWGIPGAFIGVPLMSIIKICCDHIESLSPIGDFLGARSEPTRSAAAAEAVLA